MFANTILTTLVPLVSTNSQFYPNPVQNYCDINPQPPNINRYLSDEVFDIDRLRFDLSEYGEGLAKELYDSFSQVKPDDKLLPKDPQFLKLAVKSLKSSESLKKNDVLITKIIIELLYIKLKELKEERKKYFRETNCYHEIIKTFITSEFIMNQNFLNNENSEEIPTYEISLVKILRVFLFDIEKLKSVIGRSFYSEYEYNLYLIESVMLFKQEIKNDAEIRKFYGNVFSEIVCCREGYVYSILDPDCPETDTNMLFGRYLWFVYICIDAGDYEPLKGLNAGFTMWVFKHEYSKCSKIKKKERIINAILIFLDVQTSKGNSKELEKLYLFLFYVTKTFKNKDGLIGRLENFYEVFKKTTETQMSGLDFDKIYEYNPSIKEDGNTTPEFIFAYNLFLYVLGVGKEPTIEEKEIDVIKLLNILSKVDYFDAVYEKNRSLELKGLSNLRCMKLFTSEENIGRIITDCDNEIFLRSRLAKEIFSTEEFAVYYKRNLRDNFTKLKEFLYKYVYYQGTSLDYFNYPENKPSKKKSILFWSPSKSDKIMSSSLSKTFKDLTKNFILEEKDLSKYNETERIIYVVNFLETLEEAAKKDKKALDFIDMNSKSYIFLEIFLKDENFRVLISENKKGRELFNLIFQKFSELQDKHFETPRKWTLNIDDFDSFLE